MAGRECSICMMEYDFTRNGHLNPVQISCGHTFSRDCLLAVSTTNRTCPICRLVFTGDVATMPINFGIKELMEASVQPSAPPLNLLEGQVAQLTAAAAATRRTSQTAQAASSRQLAQSQQQAAQSQHQATLAQAQLQSARSEQARSQIQGSARLQSLNEDLELQRALAKSMEEQQLQTVLALTAGSRDNRSYSHLTNINGNQNGNGSSSSSSSGSSSSISGGSSNGNGSYTGQAVIRIASENFMELLRLLNNASPGTVFDLCGRHCRHTGNDAAVITGSGITMCNGTIHVASGPKQSGPSLCIKGRGVLMEDVTINGGEVGVWVDPGGDLTLKNCRVQNAYIGIWVGSAESSGATTRASRQQTSRLTAVGLKVLGCSKGSGLGVGSGGAARLRDCEISGGNGCGILVCGDLVPGQLTATDVRCMQNVSHGMVVKAGSQAAMTHCRFKDNGEGSLLVRGQGSKARLDNCELDVAGVAIEGGRLQDGAGGWMQQLLGFGS